MSRLFQSSIYCRRCLCKVLPHQNYPKKFITTSELMNHENDFFGISSYESARINKRTNETPKHFEDSIVDPIKKYSHLRSAKANLERQKKELVYDMPFGSVRFDENKESTSSEMLLEDQNFADSYSKHQDMPLQTDNFYLNLRNNENLPLPNNIDQFNQCNENIDDQYFGSILVNDYNSEHVLQKSPNIIKNHEMVSSEKNYSSQSTNIFDEQYFDLPFEENKVTESLSADVTKELKDVNYEKASSDLVDEQYFQFPSVPQSQHNEEINKSEEIIKVELVKSVVENNLKESDELLVNSNAKSTKPQNLTYQQHTFDSNKVSNSGSNSKKKLKDGSSFPGSNISNQRNDNDTENVSDSNYKPFGVNDATFTNRKSSGTSKSVNVFTKIKDSTPEDREIESYSATVTAYDFIKNVRNEKHIPNPTPDNEADIFMQRKLVRPTENVSRDKLDSKGFVIMKSRVPDLWKHTNSEMVTMLKKNVVYNDYDIVALNKPYGMCCISSESDSKSVCLSDYLSDLAKFACDNSDAHLYITHRLDRNTSGVILLAKTQRMATILSEMFAERKILKTYYALVKGVPQHLEGIIDIPIMEGKIGNKFRMVLSPEIKSENGSVMKFSSSKADKAVTHYKVLQSQMSMSLLEVKPKTGYKHQIRVHLGFGLGCPIIGDHKYSYLTKLVPQKLSGDVLDALGIRQSKVRDIPMHLHSKSVMLPELFEGRNIFIETNLPKYFTKTLHSLHFRKIN